MKINRDTLLKAIAGPCKLASKRTTLPILNHLLLSAKGNRLTVTASNIDMYEEVTLNCDGALSAIAVPARLFSELLRRCGDEVEIQPKGKKLGITSGSQRAEISVLDANEFPAFPNVGGSRLTLDGAALASAIRLVAWAAAASDTGRPQLECVYIQADGNQIDMVASDGKTIAHTKIEAKTEAVALLIHHTSIESFCDAIESGASEVANGSNWIGVTAESRRIAIKKPEYQYMDVWRKIVFSESGEIGAVNRDALLSPVESACLMQTDNWAETDLEFSDRGIGVVRKSGANDYSGFVEGKFKEHDVRIDAVRLGHALRNLDSDNATVLGGELPALKLKGERVIVVIGTLKKPAK
jgi:DNA polymerase III sliding clamp (beta) subunit (PCNA family)